MRSSLARPSWMERTVREEGLGWSGLMPLLWNKSIVCFWGESFSRARALIKCRHWNVLLQKTIFVFSYFLSVHHSNCPLVGNFFFSFPSHPSKSRYDLHQHKTKCHKKTKYQTCTEEDKEDRLAISFASNDFVSARQLKARKGEKGVVLIPASH